MSTDFTRAAGIQIQIPKSILTVLNQLYEVEQKLKKSDSPTSIGRNLAKMKDALAEEGLPGQDYGGGQIRITLAYEDPMGQPYKETRTDVEATVSGDSKENLVVVEVIKPIIRATTWKSGEREICKIVQQGIVIVASRKAQAEP